MRKPLELDLADPIGLLKKAMEADDEMLQGVLGSLAEVHSALHFVGNALIKEWERRVAAKAAAPLTTPPDMSSVDLANLKNVKES